MVHLSLDPFFLSVAESRDDCISILDPNGLILFVNECGREFLQLKAEANYLGASWTSLCAPELQPAFARGVEMAAAGERSAFRAYSSQNIWWRNTVAPIRDPASGRIVALIVTSRDVTIEVRHATLLDIVTEHVPTPIMAKTASDGRYWLANRAAEVHTGCAAEDMVGRTDHEIFPHPLAEMFCRKDCLLLEDEDAPLFMVQEGIPNGRRGSDVLRVKTAVVREAGRPSHIVVAAENLTDELRVADELSVALADAEAASRAKSAFLANMSHEIRTPLNGVVGVAGALAKTSLAPAQREMVSIIETSARTLETLLGDILDLARIEAGKMELRPEPFDLATSVGACAALFDASAQAKGLDLEVAIAAGAAGLYMGDAARIRQILSNLLSNAVKFTAKGKVSLRITAQPGADASRLSFEVADTGIGFDAAAKARLFSRFEQADSSITRSFGGSGLGLAISRALTEAMGGELDAEATPGEGARFTLTIELPRCTRKLEGADEAVRQIEPATEPLAALRILVAEDHPTNRRVIELILGAAGLELTCVENGSDAVQAVERQTFDLVLMDMQMPVMDGLTAIRRIRAREDAQRLPRMPIHVLTANAMPEHVAASLAAGADGHLSKPIFAERLLELVADVAMGTAA